MKRLNMEDMNHVMIMGRTVPDGSRRHAYTPSKPGPGASAHSALSASATPEHLVQQPPSGPSIRYTAGALPEQMARSGQKHPYSSQNAQPPTPRARPRPQATYGPQPRRQYSEEEQGVQGTRRQPPTTTTRQSVYANDPYNAPNAPSRAQRNDDYLHASHTPHADAIPVWETEEEEPGMRYEDWESDEPITYQRADVEIVTNPYHSYPASYPSRPNAPAAYTPESEIAEQRVRPTPERRAPSMPMSPVPTPALPGRETPRVQPHVPHMQRMTQPLNPRAHEGMGHEYTQGEKMPRIPHTPTHSQSVPTRQLAPTSREASARLAAPARGTCPVCKGAGYLRANVQFGHPQFGKPIACQCKEQEMREKRRQQLLELSDIGAFRTKSFNNFDRRAPGIHPSVQEAFEVAYSFAQNPNGWLLLVGPNGCGKTHLAAAAANYCLNEGEVVLFSVVPQLLDHLRAAFAPSSSEVYDQLFAKMREAGLLVLDDLGAHYGTPWAAEKLFQLLNYRYNWRMPTIITCNIPGWESLDIRLRSRMADNSLVVTVNLERARDCRPYLIRQEP